MIEKLEEKFTKYEVARILGARALQIAMDAPLLLKISEEDLDSINYNPLEIAKRELLAEVLPITVKRPMPQKKDSKIKKVSKEYIEELKKKESEISSEEDKKTKDMEEEQKRIEEEAEIMELAKPEDEIEENLESSEEEL